MSLIITKVGSSVPVVGAFDGDRDGDKLGASVSEMTVLFKTYRQLVDPITFEGSSHATHGVPVL